MKQTPPRLLRSPAPKSAILSMRIPADLKARIERRTRKAAYRLTISQVVERGIELALAELDDANSKEPRA